MASQTAADEVQSGVLAQSSAPPSSVGKRWNPVGASLFVAALFGAATSFGVAIGPYFSKPDLSDYVKSERLTACEAKLDDRAKAHETALDGERERTSKCYDKLGACQSHSGAQEVVIESLETRKRR